jgi:ribA/ribD-fused uncharacterized protein
MEKALIAKFRQHADLRSRLHWTGQATLIENAENDYCWGCGADRTGKNHLGRLLMQIRETLPI